MGQDGEGWDAESRDRVVALYRRSLGYFGPTAEGLYWTSRSTQEARFAVLADVGEWAGATVADIGCGVGDFFGFLRDRGHRTRYTGYDITPEMIAAARARYGREARFAVRDILAEGLPGRFDYVVASGTFNIRVKDHDAYLRRMLAVMYAACRRAVAVNVLKPDPASGRKPRPGRADFLYSLPPEDLLAIGHALSGRAELREEYLPLDATVFVYRGPRRGAPSP